MPHPLQRLRHIASAAISRATRSNAHEFTPVEATDRDLSLMQLIQPFTMTSRERVWALLQATRYVIANDVKGDLVEVGVWQGGSLMAMGSVLQQEGAFDRKVWGYDTFNGMTTPSPVDVESIGGRTAATLLSEQDRADPKSVWCAASMAVVTGNLRHARLTDINFELVEGDVRGCTNLRMPEAIALLRLDTDWFDSTYASLTHFYPLLETGGVCIIDDYGHWSGARQAVDQYLREVRAKPLMFHIDYTGRLFLKT